MSYLKIGEASKRLGIDIQTLRLWVKQEKIDVFVTPTGHRLFESEVIDAMVTGKKSTKIESSKKQCMLYARVSTKKQSESGNLDRQIARLSQFAIENGYEIVGLYKEIASGMDENRKELDKMLNHLKVNQNLTVLVEYKDRLARFGFRYLKKYIHDSNNQLVIMEEKETSEEQELVEDLIAITTSFSARIYGKRGGKSISKKIERFLKEGEKDENHS
ncbi:TPA: IS607 family transposase, partial [Bacillus pseudomycoides]|nr:IS607 family transposase [Bacillus pseudomycoides]